MIGFFLKRTVLLILNGLFLFGILPVSAQLNQGASEKIWPNRPIDSIRSNYLDANGFPSRDFFLKKHGLWPSEETNKVLPYFTVSFNQDDLHKSDEKWPVTQNANPLNMDFYLENVREYQSANIVTPIWDGRVYEDMYNILVGGYSSRYNERPVGKFNDAGQFTPMVDKQLFDEFPILKIPAKQIIFDPFEWKILKIEPTRGTVVRELSKNFLPMLLFDKNGQLISAIQYAIKKSDQYLILYGIMGEDSVKLAQCDLTDKVIRRHEGYQPELQQGCLQPANGKVVTFTFEGQLSEKIILKNKILCLDHSFKNKTVAGEKMIRNMEIDGYFNDWRNISGISDPEADYVSYLYPNPDTDILEFKVSNDDRHLYFYSRVAGAFGRTGSNGRYYWYTYIDVDANPNTGYPPTRDDNCYFGIAIGDDCEAQFEFVGNMFIKTFFGFTGMGAEQEVLAGKLTLGPSYYSPTDLQGKKRDRYKIEYVNRNGSRFITHDNTPGTSEDIIMALSADGSEMEMRVALKGFLWDGNGKPLVSKGQVINIAVGAEGASDFYGSDKWGADSSPVIYGYKIK